MSILHNNPHREDLEDAYAFMCQHMTSACVFCVGDCLHCKKYIAAISKTYKPEVRW